MCRFGFHDDGKSQTLEEIGVGIGVSKERVRQLQLRALNKLRIAAKEESIEVPEW
jgi:RNA polymerase primary sigma factor/RNA polymerase sigma factor